MKDNDYKDGLLLIAAMVLGFAVAWLIGYEVGWAERNAQKAQMAYQLISVDKCGNTNVNWIIP